MALLSNYYRVTNSFTVLNNSFFSHFTFNPVFIDINNDGFQDMLVLGADYPIGQTNYLPQQGELLIGNANGSFTKAPEWLFPSSTLQTVHPRKVLTGDLNDDGYLDIFISNHGWDASPFPGEQNRLYLSKGDGTWYDATSKLPQLSDFSHSAAMGDINNDGRLDIFVGDGYYAGNGIFSYALINKGNDTFALDRSVIPGAGSFIDFNNGSNFPGSTLVDLNKDGFPELLITPDASESWNKTRNVVIYWNDKGKYTNDNYTLLPQPKDVGTQIGLDSKAIDINGDGLLDIVSIGTQGKPFYDGWYVQIVLNEGEKKFVDVTSKYLSAADSWGGIHSATSNTPWPMWVNVIDFNHDGFMDFYVNYNGGTITDNTPILWLNDGTGHFSTLKYGDFIDPTQKNMFGSFVMYQDGDNNLDIANVYNYNNSLWCSSMVQITPYNAKLPSSGSAELFGDNTNDTFTGGTGDDFINGGQGVDTANYTLTRSSYGISTSGGFTTVAARSGTDGTDSLTNVEKLQFSDMSVDLTMAAQAALLTPLQLQTLEELYVGFFNRVPEANGLSYWISQIHGGATLREVADQFYSAGVQFGVYDANMTEAQFITKVYENVLGRTGVSAPDNSEIGYWQNWLHTGTNSKGAMVLQMLNDSHNFFTGDPVVGWVIDLLDNKAAVANYFGIEQGISYNTPEENIDRGIAIAALITPTDISEAITLIGITDQII